jgi:uncharacterized membrane protein
VNVPQFRGERRWPAALAIVALIAIPFLLPKQVFPRVLWATAPIEIALLAVLAVADPGRIDRRSQLLRGLSIGLTMLFAVIAAVLTVLLALELVDGAPDLKDASTLLTTGALVWIDINLTFALLYSELDGGGAAERLHARRKYSDFAFPEDLNPRVAPPGWRPIFADYLYLGFTNATAFSPTDVMLRRSPTATTARHWLTLRRCARAKEILIIASRFIRQSRGGTGGSTEPRAPTRCRRGSPQAEGMWRRRDAHDAASSSRERPRNRWRASAPYRRQCGGSRRRSERRRAATFKCGTTYEPDRPRRSRAR